MTNAGKVVATFSAACVMGLGCNNGFAFSPIPTSGIPARSFFGFLPEQSEIQIDSGEWRQRHARAMPHDVDGIPAELTALAVAINRLGGGVDATTMGRGRVKWRASRLQYVTNTLAATLSACDVSRIRRRIQQPAA